MNELAVSFLRLSYLLVLWLFVLLGLNALRRDVYGLSITRRGNKASSRRSGRISARVAAPPELAARLPARSPQPSSNATVAVPSPSAHPGTATRLVVVNGPLRGTSLPLGRGLLIGRSSAANLVLDDEFTSGRHARLVPDADGWLLEDLGSTNGTFLGREQVRGVIPVQVGQSIRIGQTQLELAGS